MAIKKTAEKAKQNNSTSTTSATSSLGTNYQQDINDAVSRGDYASAAKYEQLRNEKINNLNASGTNIYGATTTNNYSQYLGTTPSNNSSPVPTTQYTQLGAYNDSGLPSSVKTQIDQYKVLYNNAMANGNTLGAQAAHNAAEALRKQYGYSGGGDGSQFIALGSNTPYVDFNYNEPMPTYEGKYDNGMDALLNQILNRDDFSYDVATDPLYQQYAQMYQREGDRAMRETMAEAAAGAGGMNSYAITAAQQANNYYNSQLNDKIPELYNIAYDKYLGEIEGKARDLGLLQNMDATQYNRYLTTLNNWQNDRNFAYGMYRDDIADQQWNKQFDYNSFINDRNFAYDSDWRNKEWDFNVGQTQLENERIEREIAREDVWKLISLGKTPSPELVAKSGISQADVDLAVAAAQAEKKGGTSSRVRTVNEDEEDETELTGTTYAGLGLGPVADLDALVLNLAENGIVELYEDGSVGWAPGYNASNYHKAQRKFTSALYPTLQF